MACKYMKGFEGFYSTVILIIQLFICVALPELFYSQPV
jgi:hypothetical protein